MIRSGDFFCVKVSSSRDEKIGDEKGKNLPAKGFNSFVVIIELPNSGEIFYTVGVGVGYITPFEEVKRINHEIIKCGVTRFNN